MPPMASDRTSTELVDKRCQCVANPGPESPTLSCAMWFRGGREHQPLLVRNEEEGNEKKQKKEERKRRKEEKKKRRRKEEKKKKEKKKRKTNHLLRYWRGRSYIQKLPKMKPPPWKWRT